MRTFGLYSPTSMARSEGLVPFRKVGKADSLRRAPAMLPSARPPTSATSSTRRRSWSSAAGRSRRRRYQAIRPIFPDHLEPRLVPLTEAMTGIITVGRPSDFWQACTTCTLYYTRCSSGQGDSRPRDGGATQQIKRSVEPLGSASTSNGGCSEQHGKYEGRHDRAASRSSRGRRRCTPSIQRSPRSGTFEFTSRHRQCGPIVLTRQTRARLRDAAPESRTPVRRRSQVL